MKLIAAFFRLIRWKNLLILLATQTFLWWVLVWRLAQLSFETYFLSPLHYIGLSFSTICIMAAGNIINDYLDIKIDLRNKPDRVVIGTYISKRWAIALHTLLNSIGIGLAAYLSWKVGNPFLIGMQIACSLILWVYSTHFKRMYVVGNFTVACLTGFAVLLILFYEPMLFKYLQRTVFIKEYTGFRLNPAYVIIVYSFFAFMLTWMREIVKDMEDFQGDKEEGCITMPIKDGLFKSGKFVALLGYVTIAPLLYVCYELLMHQFYAIGSYIIFFLVLSMLSICININKKATPKHYAKMSRHLKIIMLLGVFTILLIILI